MQATESHTLEQELPSNEKWNGSQTIQIDFDNRLKW